MVWLPRVYALRLILETRLGKQDCLGKLWIQSNSQQFVWLEELRTVSQFKKSLMNALHLTMTYIETEDSLRGSCCWERHQQTSQVAKILIWLSAVSKLWTKLRHSVSVKDESYNAYNEEELSLRKRRKEIHQARPWRHWATGERCWYWRFGKYKGSRMKGGVFLGPARALWLGDGRLVGQGLHHQSYHTQMHTTQHLSIFCFCFCCLSPSVSCLDLDVVMPTWDLFRSVTCR